jgi:hypothetical protein
MPYSLRPLLALVPLIVAVSVLNYHNTAYVPALLLAILAGKHWGFPPLLRRLSKPEATSRLKFNLFVLLHLAILILVFPPYISIKRGVVWYVDEYLQGRRGGQKSWAVAGVQAAGESMSSFQRADGRMDDCSCSSLECNRSDDGYQVPFTTTSYHTRPNQSFINENLFASGKST